MRIASIIDTRRLLIAAPVLLAVAAAIWFIAARDATSGTARASLVDTPPGAAGRVGVQQGQLARDFIAEDPSGREVRLSDLRGAPTIINFWASWCTSCLAEMPDFKALQERLGPENLNIVAVNVGERADDARKFIAVLEADTFRYGLDPTLVVSDAYGVIGLPTSVFLDADGVVRAVYSGHLGPQTMADFVAAVSEGRDAAEPDPKLRLVTTVARENVLDVRTPAGNRLELRAKALRCDDSYCADAAIDALAQFRGVIQVDRYVDEDPPRVSVRFEPEVAEAGAIVDALLALLAAEPDPLYERALEVRWR